MICFFGLKSISLIILFVNFVNIHCADELVFDCLVFEFHIMMSLTMFCTVILVMFYVYLLLL